MALTPVQVRVLGCLMEKERLTPDNYPLTLNGLLAACNQSSNRHPVIKLEEPTVSNALLNLRGLNLVRIVYSRSNRADRYRHVLDEELGLDPGQSAILCLLMLRGPQTASELRNRSERLHSFDGQEDVDDALHRLAGRDEPLVTLLDRQPGQREQRWAQVLGAELPGAGTARPDPAGTDSEADRPPTGAASTAATAPATDTGHGGIHGHLGDVVEPTAARLAALESAIQSLREEVAQLRAEHEELVRELG